MLKEELNCLQGTGLHFNVLQIINSRHSPQRTQYANKRNKKKKETFFHLVIAKRLLEVLFS